MKITLSGKKSISEDIADQYRKLIVAGVLAYGEQLPTCRGLAAELGVNPNTIDRAYSILEAQGIIKSLPKKGSFANFEAKDDDSKDQVELQLIDIKNQGISKDELHKIIEKIYGDSYDKGK